MKFQAIVDLRLNKP